jgi:alkanesulfonate monooxygenase
MRIRLPGRTIEVFTISPRTTDETKYWLNIEKVIDWSERFDCTGILLFTGNDTYVEPWIAGHTVMARTTNLSPLVAVNPVYMHPFTAAKMVSTFAYLYRRKTYLNMVAGTALSHLHALNDHLSHDDRYVRLQEYILLIKALVSSSEPINFEGQYYKATSLQLLPRTPDELQPVFFLAGQSEAAKRMSKAVGSVHMQMLPPSLESDLTKGMDGIHFGVVTREDEALAWEVARATFPEDRYGQRVLTFSMNNTDAVWKMRMKQAAEMAAAARPGYFLEPFRNFKADCPYFIGSHEQVAELIASLVLRGINMFILDIPAQEEEFRHVDLAFKKAETQLLQAFKKSEAQNDIRFVS